MNEQHAVTPKEFAGWLKAVGDMREGSYDPEGGLKYQDGTPSGKYRLHYDECIAACVPEEWRTIFDCLLTAGYCDMWNWADAQLAE